MSEAKYIFGDLPPDEYKSNRPHLITPGDLDIGECCTLMFRSLIIGGHQYYSTYPVQVADIRMSGDGCEVELVHLNTKDESWTEGPKAVFIHKNGLIGLKDEAENGSGFYDHGFLFRVEGNGLPE
jgi:hypothetical protein